MHLKKAINRTLSLLLAAATLLSVIVVPSTAAVVPSHNKSLGDGSSTVTIKMGNRLTVLNKSSGGTYGGESWSYTSNDGITGPAYCVNYGLNAVSSTKKLQITGRYDRSPKTMGAFAAGYPQRTLEQFKELNPDIQGIDQLTTDEFAYATQIAVWATCGQVAVPGTSFSSGRSSLVKPTSGAQKIRVYESVLAILKMADSWDRPLYSSLYFHLEKDQLESSLTIQHEEGLEGAARDAQAGIKKETINGKEYYTRLMYIDSGTSTYPNDYVIYVYSMDAPAGTIITDTNNQVYPTREQWGATMFEVPTAIQYTSLNANGSAYTGAFKLCLPCDDTAETGSVKVEAYSVITQFNLYLANNPNTSEQSYIIADPAYIGKFAAADIKWSKNEITPDTASLQVQKVDGSAMPLEGAEFTLTGSKGTQKTGISDRNGYVEWTDLPADETFVLTESKAPAGFSVVAPRNITLTAGQTSHVTIQDSTVKRFTIKKIDKQNGSTLQGAVFRFEQIDGTYTTTGTTGFDGMLEFAGDELPFGSYRVSEERAPTNYEKDISVQTVKWDGTKDILLTFENVRQPSIVVSKVDGISGISLPGATFDIFKDGKKIGSATTNDSGEFQFPIEAGAGYYEFIETVAPEGYQLDPTPHGIFIDPYDPQTEDDPVLTIRNYSRPGLRIIKLDQKTGDRLAGVTFKIYKDSALFDTATTDEQGEVVYYDLEPGTYLVTEFATDDGHVIDLTPQQIELKAGQQEIVELTFFNGQKPGMRLIKVDSSDPAKVIPGAVFEIKSVDGSFGPKEFTTNQDGEIDLSKLPDGSYVVTEKSCAGYVVDDAQRIIELRANQTSEFVFTNTKKPGLRLVKTSADGTPLDGVTFKITPIGDASHSIDRTTANGGEIFVEDLAPGVYSVTETATLPDHILDTTEYHVELIPGKTSELRLSNNKKPGFKLIKTSADGTPLEGITFRISRIEDGSRYLDRTTNAKGEIEVSDLEPGMYSVVETATLPDHILDETEHHVELFPNKTSELRLSNDKRPTLIISKTDKDTGKPVPGVTFTLKATEGPTITTKPTGADGKITIPNLMPGVYTITEQSVPENYILDTTPQTVTLFPNKETQVEFQNYQRPTLKIVKVDINGKHLTGAIFEVKTKAGVKIGDFPVGPDGTIEVPQKHLAEGYYIITEKQAPEGYILDKTPHEVYLRPGKTTEISIENEKKPGLTIYKVDSVVGDGIKGAKFEIYVSKDKTENGTYQKLDSTFYYTDANGIIHLDNLDTGWYKIVEVEPPAGYMLKEPSEQIIYVQHDATVEVTFENIPKSGLVIRKIDADTGAPLPNAWFRVRYLGGTSGSGGTIIGEYATSSNGNIIITGLDAGTYIIEEINAPDGYVIDTAPQTAYISGKSQDCITLTFTNSKYGSLLVKKVDSTTGEPLSDVQFFVTTSDGSVLGDSNGYFTTDSAGTILVSDIMPGTTLVVKETRAKPGYVLDETPQTVKITSNETKTLEFSNQPMGSLLIRKVCAVNPSVTLQNAEFKVTYADGQAVGSSNGVYRSDENGEVRIDNLIPGKSVVVTETKAPAGFIIDTQSQTIEIKAGQTATLTFKNQPKGAIIIQKRDSQTNQPLPGAEFRVTTAAGCEVGLDGVIGTSSLTQNGLFRTDSNGEIRISNLAPGAYVLTETKAPDGYVMDAPSTNVVIGANGDTQTVLITNTQKGNLIVEKYDSVTKQPLSGAQFKITTASGELVADNQGLTSSNGLYTTNRVGQITLSKLIPGTYIVTETKAPDGYRQDPTPQTVVVNAGDTQSLRFYDDPLCTLTILKRDAVTRKPLKGAEFTVTDSEGRAIGPSNGKYITGTDGTVTVAGMQPNATIVVSESKAPTGYIRDETPKNIVVRTGVANSLAFDNKPSTTLIIQKFIEGTEKEPLSGVEFRVTDGSGAAVGPDDGRYYTDKAGEIVLTGLEPGTTVKAREIKTVEGFVLDGTPQDIQIKAGEVQRLTFWNKRDCSLTILKQSTSKEPLIGAVFHVTDEDGGAIGTNNGRYTTDRNGLITITGLQPGQVLIVTEEKAPNGYVKDSTPKTIKIKQDTANSLIFENPKAGSLIINKRSSVDKATPLEGVTFKITTTTGEFLPDEQGKISSNGLYYTDENGQITLNSVVGSLVVTEVKTIDGYTIHEANRTQTVEVKPDDTQTLYFYNDPLCSLTITKLDSVTGKPVPGTEFTVKDGSGNVLGRYTTGKDGTVTVTGLVPNSTVVVTESKVPEGYVLNTTPQTITVKNGTSNTLVSGNAGGNSGSGNGLTFENDPTVTLTIRKYIEGTKNEPLAEVAFKLTDSSGAAVGTSDGVFYTNDAGEIVIEGLEPGTTITAREIKTVDGFVLDGTPKTIKIVSGKAAELTFWNKRAGNLVIRKLDKQTGKPLAGVQFELTYAEGGYVDTDNGHLSSNGLYITNDHGEIHISGVVGTIVVKETRTLPGYTIDPSTQTQTVTVKPQETQTLTFYNTPANTLTIKKYEDGTDNIPLAGVEFLVTDSTGAAVGPNNGYYTTDKNGRIVISGLTPGVTVTVTETRTLEGYVLDSKPQTITIREGEAQSLTFRNKKAGTLVIRKLDSVTRKPLAGVEFQLTYANGSYVDADNGHLSSKGLYTTDRNGEIRISGVVGTIVATETRTISGYIIDETDRTQTVTVNPQDTQTITFYNAPKQTLTLQKYVDGTTTPIQGVTFLVTDSSGQMLGPNNGEYVTDRNGRIVLTDLTPGTTITAKEVRTVEGFVLDSTPQSILIKEGAAQTLTFFNKAEGGLELIKVSESDRTQRIPNTTFEVRRMDGGLVDTVTTDGNGRVRLALDAGSYYAVEIEAAEGFKLDNTPHYFTIQDGKTTTVTVTNKPLSGILIHKTDSVTGKGLYGVTFLLYDSKNTPIGQYTSDNSGYVYIEGLTASGRYYLRELENKGYVPDTEMKTVYVTAGEMTLIEWKNTPVTGQIQITKKSADYNPTNGLPAGTLLEGAVFEIYDKAGNLVDTIKSDSRGLAVSRQLPLDRYTIREVKAPDNYGVSDEVLTAYLEHAGQIVRFEVTNKSLTTGVSITKTGPNEVMAGQPVRYTFSSIANNSNVRLDSFFWRDTIPAEVRLDTIVTGTYNFPGTYKITYRVNGGEPRTLADNLSTSKNYTLAASNVALGLASNERVTEIMFVFGQAPAGFAQVEKPMLYCTALNNLTTTSFVNVADVGGVYNGQWVQAVSRWVTKVYGKPTTLPKTGY